MEVEGGGVYFDSKWGLRQGFVISPFLLNVFFDSVNLDRVVGGVDFHSQLTGKEKNTKYESSV